MAIRVICDVDRRIMECVQSNHPEVEQKILGVLFGLCFELAGILSKTSSIADTFRNINKLSSNLYKLLNHDDRLALLQGALKNADRLEFSIRFLDDLPKAGYQVTASLYYPSEANFLFGNIPGERYFTFSLHADREGIVWNYIPGLLDSLDSIMD